MSLSTSNGKIVIHNLYMLARRRKDRECVTGDKQDMVVSSRPEAKACTSECMYKQTVEKLGQQKLIVKEYRGLCEML